MNDNRRELNARIDKGIERGRAFDIEVDGEKVVAYEGESIAAALLASGKSIFRRTLHGSPRGIYCGMGICFECRMIVNGKPNVRICQTLATPNCRIRTQVGLGNLSE